MIEIENLTTRFGDRTVLAVVDPSRLEGVIFQTAPLLRRRARERGLIRRDKSGTLRQKLVGRGDGLPDTHPAAAYRGAFTDNDLLDNVGVAG